MANEDDSTQARYAEDLAKAQAEYTATLARHDKEREEMEERQEAEIKALDQRVEALETLIRLGYPYPDGHIETRTATAAQIHVAVQKPNLTESVRRILAASNEPLTSPEIRAKLQDTGTFRFIWRTDKGNPWAMIHSVCRNLVRKGDAREVFKGNRRAWERAK